MPAGAGWFSVISDKPKIPKFQTVDIGAETASSVAENLANLPKVAELAKRYNEMSAEQLTAAMEKMMPGYTALRDNTTASITSMSKGEVPKDVEELLARKAAERGITLGTSGSQFQSYDELRNLGLTSLDMINRGLDSAMRWIDSTAQRTPVYNMSSSFLPIEQRVNLRFQENQFKYQRDLLAAKVKAIPWGWKAVVGNVSNAVTDDLHHYGQMMAGFGASSMMGGGGAGGGGMVQKEDDATPNWGQIKQDQSYNNYGL